MAIKIPSKYIYEIDDNKVIDNEVDNLEVGAVNGKEVYDYKTIVFDSDYTDLGLYGENNQDVKGDSAYHRASSATTAEMEYYAEVISYVNIRPAYTTITIKIPKNQADRIINKIYGKEDISYTLIFAEKTITPITVEVHISSDDHQPKENNVSVTSVEYSRGRTEEISDVQLKNYLSVDNPVSETSYQYTSVSANATKTLENKENLLSKEAYLNTDNEWELVNLTFLTAVDVEKASYTDAKSQQYSATSFPITPSTNARALTGKAETYEAKQLSVTIYGDTITLDLQDETLKIGDENGQHIYSFSGNELMQTTNTDSVNNVYQKVVDSWKEGKEVATLRCAIADYSDGDITTITITSATMTVGGDYSCAFQGNYNFLRNQIIYYGELQFVVQSWIINSGRLTVQAKDIDKIILQQPIKVIAGGTGDLISPNSDKMYFAQGDIVEPYIYGANGEDRPMSMYKNGVAKRFKIISVGISTDNGITQEIICQET